MTDTAAIETCGPIGVASRHQGTVETTEHLDIGEGGLTQTLPPEGGHQMEIITINSPQTIVLYVVGATTQQPQDVNSWYQMME